jgi:hypothetical protein
MTFNIVILNSYRSSSVYLMEPGKIEGVYNGKPKHTICAVRNFALSAKPYTESGDKFQIPDMLANRDIYNLGDIIEIRLTYLN